MDGIATINFDSLAYGISTVDFIRQALSGYTGGVAIARELIQNADDAKADTIRFHFCPDALVVTNTSSFREQDFINIYRIASGGKRDEKMTTGTWGTGFVSVYHITDRPELESSGRHIVFNPNESKPLNLPMQATQGTLFRLPWRRVNTDDGQRMNAAPWTNEQIHHLRGDTVRSIYALSIFLRHVRVIEVYDGSDAEPWGRVERRQMSNPVNLGIMGQYCREDWEISFKQRGQQAVCDRWLYYRYNVAPMPSVAGIKDLTVTIACPIKERDWLVKNVPYRLYNFLPTEIETEYPFHLNGPFFPDNNRKGIIIDDDTNRGQSAWNTHVIDGLARLATDALLDLRDHIPTQQRFFELLPLTTPASHAYLRPIHNTFMAAAPDLPIACTTLGDWRRPRDVLFPLRIALRELAAPYLPIISPEAPARVQKELRESLGGRALTWQHVVEFVKGRIDRGVTLDDAHSMINTRERLFLLYGVLEEASSSFIDPDKALLAKANLCLDADGQLYPFDYDTPRADEEARRLLDFWIFVDPEVQVRFAKVCAAMLPECTGALAVELLSVQEWQASAITSDAWPHELKEVEHLAAILRYIARDIDNVDRVKLRELPIVRAENDALARGRDSVYLCSDAHDRDVARAVGLMIVHPDFAADEPIRTTYRAAGVIDLQPRDIIGALRLSQLQPDVPHKTRVAYLTALYDFFVRQADSLTEQDRSDLRSLPIYLTQGDRLVSANGPQSVFLPGVAQNDPVLAHLNTLHRDNLVHGDLISHQFLTAITRLGSFGPAELIVNVMLPYYAKLGDTARLATLTYVRDHLVDLSEQHRDALRANDLIRCGDGQYRPGCEVYFASPALDVIFMGHYPRPHGQYGIPAAQPQDGENPCYQLDSWYGLFRNSGVKNRATAADLVAAVERIVGSGGAIEENLAALRPLYDEISRVVTGTLREADSKALGRLRDLSWLPSSNKVDRWFRPHEIYQQQYIGLIGDEAPVLGFTERRELREYLGMPTEPPALFVARHLLAVTRRRQPLKPDEYKRIFQYLGGQRWHTLDEAVRAQLQQEPIVCHADTFWPSRHVFLAESDELRRLFGGRRCYVAALPDDARVFLANLGAREQPQPWFDSIELLREIAHEYRDGAIVEDTDLALIWRTLDYLGKQCHASDAGEIESGLVRLRRLAIVPDKDARLHRPDHIVRTDDPELRRRFDDDAFPEIDPAWASADASTLLDQLETPRLHKMVQRHAAEAERTQDDSHAQRLTLRLHSLVSAFKRIGLRVRTHTSSAELASLGERIGRIQVVACRRLRVSYILDDRRGWRVEGYTTDAETLYDYQAAIIYAKCDAQGKLSEVAVARELDQVHFPEHAQVATINHLLSMPQQAGASQYLRELGYPTLPADDAEEVDVVDGVANIINWGDARVPERGEPTDPYTASERIDNVEADTAKPIDSEYRAQELSVQVIEEDPSVVEAGNAALTEQPSTMVPTIVAPADQRRPEVPRSIPPFRESPELRSPALANQYDELTRKYGFDPEEIYATAQAADVAWHPDEVKTDEGEARPILQTRFTLDYAQRTEGFLALHAVAQLMLDDHPQVLHCQTDYTDWSFDLYVDYQCEKMYNQQALSEFFEAYNIPAGGIVYLARLSAETVRLFWRPEPRTIENVAVLEKQGDGTFVEVAIPAVEVLCEVDEYIFRCEKRFEDMRALHAQAVGKRGVFQTICEVFGTANRELSYREIFDGVMARRQVADATIRMILSSRPCFVNIGGLCWRFEPQLGYGHATASPSRQARPGQGREGGRMDGHRTPVQVLPPDRTPADAGGSQVTPTESMATASSELAPFEELRRRLHWEWSELCKSLRAGADPKQSVIDFLSDLQAWAMRVRAEFEALARPAAQSTELCERWRAFCMAPNDQEAYLALQAWLRGNVDHDPESAVRQIAAQLAQTPQYLRDEALYPLIDEAAQWHAGCGQERSARALYELLRDHQAANVEAPLADLDASAQVRQYIEQVKQCEDTDDQWEWWRAAWEDYPGHPVLRTAIQEYIGDTASEVRRQTSELVGAGNPEGAHTLYATWHTQVASLADAWHVSSQIAGAVEATGRRLLEHLLHRAKQSADLPTCQCAVKVAATLPLWVQRAIDADEYVRVLSAVYNDLRRKQGGGIGAAVLFDYWMWRIEKSKQPVGTYRNLYDIRKLVMKKYDDFGFFSEAERQGNSMRSLIAAHRDKLGVAPSDENELSHWRHDLKAKIATESREHWRREVDYLLMDNEFTAFVDVQELRRQFLGIEK